MVTLTPYRSSDDNDRMLQHKVEEPRRTVADGEPPLCFTLGPGSDIDKLVDQGKLLRILHPTLREQVNQARQRGETSPYVIEVDGHFYISLAEVIDEKQRVHFYRLIQQHQAGKRVSLQELPPALQRVLQFELTQMGQFLGAGLLGGVLGVIVGVFAMALSILLVTEIGWLMNRAVGTYAGMNVTAVSFIVFTFVGWAASSFVMWRKPHLWEKLGARAHHLHRRYF